MNIKSKIACAVALTVTAAAGVALATAPDGPRGPMAGPHGPGMPSAEVLATIDGLSASQQADLRKILREQRDAEDALRTRLRSDREALDQRERSEHERIEDQTTQKLRSALGDEGYRAYALWTTQRGPGPGPRPRGAHDEGPGPRGRVPSGDAPPSAPH